MGCNSSKSKLDITTTTDSAPGAKEELEDDFVEDVVCTVIDINENEMKAFDLDEERVLVVKQNGVITAMGAKCTHYGAPLANGALGEGRVRCQWHGACFNLATGDIEDFPGQDSLPCYKVTIEDNGNVRVRARRSELQSNKRTKPMVRKLESVKERYVIIGGGPSGAIAVETLRQEGFAGEVVMVCKENYLPYDRVKVSKQMDFEISKAELRSDKFYRDNDIEVLKGVAAEAVDTGANTITLSNGKTLQYDKLYIATGSNPRKPDVPGKELKNVCVLKDYDDSAYAYPQLNKETEIVVIGSSFIGMEAANFCVDKVKSVTVIGRGAVPFRSIWGERIGAAILALFEKKGVKYIPNNGIKKINDNGQGFVSSVELNDGQIMKCDILFSGIGSTYFTDFLKGSGINMQPDGSVETNEYLQTNIPNVYVGGDIAYAPVWSHNNRKVAIVKPLSVELMNDNEPLSAGRSYELSCQVVGSRPEPTITWWKGSTQMKNTRQTTSPDGNITTSVMTFTPTVEDSGKYLSCRGQQPLIPDSGKEKGWKLDIYHVPLVTLELGSTLNGSTIKEGVDVYFECNIKSNPWVFKVSWRHDGRQLFNNAQAGTIVSNQSLVLQQITTARSGRYTCIGHNKEGDGESNPVLLDVKYIPLCRPGQQKTFGAAKEETVRIPCEVEANPTDVEFIWRFNNSADGYDINPDDIYSEKTRSVAKFIPKTEQDYGTLLCWGRNEIGIQKEPCVFYITPAGKPDSLSNCSISNQTSDSLYIECSEGYDGGLPQTFVVEVYETQHKKMVSTLTSKIPIFTVTGLESGMEFDIALLAINKKGRSPATHLAAYTLKGAEKHTALRPVPPNNCTIVNHLSYLIRLRCQVKVDQRFSSGNVYLMQIYDANTRILMGTATSQNPEDISFSELPSGHNDLLLFVRTIGDDSLASNASVIYAPAYRMIKNKAATPILLQITPLLGALIGVVAALILVAIIIVVVIRLRGGGERDDKDYDDGGLSSSGRRCVAGNNSDKASIEPLNKDMNDSVDSLEEKNPDIIPQNNADDEYQDEERAFERLNNAPSVRVYSRLPSPNNQTKNGLAAYGKATQTSTELIYAELSISTQQMTPHVVYSPRPPSIAVNMVRRQEPIVYAQLDMKRVPQGMPHPGGFHTLHHSHMPAYMTRSIRDDQMLHDVSISSETPLLGSGNPLPSIKDMDGSRKSSVSSTLQRPVTATRF